MRSVYVLAFLCFFMSSNKAFSQDKGKCFFYLRVSFPSINIATVKDSDPTPSEFRYGANGSTTKVHNIIGIIFDPRAEYFIYDNFSVSLGVSHTTKHLLIKNSDGANSGVSKYKLIYLTLPLIFKYYTRDVANNLKLVYSGGFTPDFRTAEILRGEDGAHYWNLSRNDYVNDPFRGRNGNDKSQKLFRGFDMGLFCAIGVDYAIKKCKRCDFSLYGGLSFNKGLFNIIHPDLKFNDPNRTPVNSSVKIKNNLLGVDLGFRIHIKKKTT